MIEISIIIVSFNTKEVLFNCLTSLLESGDISKAEFIVVDNNSSDGTRKMLRESFPQIKAVFNDKNLGFGVANNQGMQIAGGDYFLLLNSDTIARMDDIAKCRKYMENDPTIGVLGCRLLNVEGGLQISCGRFFSLFNAVFGGIELNKILKIFLPRKIFFWEHLLTKEEHGVTQDIDWVAGAFMLLRREVFEGTRGFDENIFLYGEEHEWCYRIKQKNWRIIYYPEVAITHIGRASGAAFNFIERGKFILSGKYYFFRKHYGLISASLFKNLIFLTSFPKFLCWGLLYVTVFNNEFFKNKVAYQIAVIKWYLNK